MKILFVYPPFYRFMGYYNRYIPYGLLTLATVAKNAGHDVLVYDADFNEQPSDIDISTVYEKSQAYLDALHNDGHPIWSEVNDVFMKFQPEVVGIQVFTDFAASAFYLAKRCKTALPSCKVIMGGPHIHVKSDEVLRICTEVDYVVIGEGEKTLLELLEHFRNPGITRDAIAGIAYRNNHAIHYTPPQEIITNLDAVPFPDRSLLLNEKKYSSEDMGLIMSARGCPFQCTYCATEKIVRNRSIAHILSEIETVRQTYHTTQFTFKDDTFTMNRDRVYEFCDTLQREGLHITWECNTRANLIDETLLRIMKQAGCNFIKIGIESGSPRMLKSMKKGVTLEQMEDAAKLFRKVGIHWTGYFMMGIPGETTEDIVQTLNVMYKLQPNFAYIAVYQPYPGTEMFYEGIDRGIIKSEMNLEDFFTLSPAHYYKKTQNIQIDTIEPIEFERIANKMKNAFHRYNKNPLRAVKMALSKLPVYFNEPGMLLEDIKKYHAY